MSPSHNHGMRPCQPCLQYWSMCDFACALVLLNDLWLLVWEWGREGGRDGGWAGVQAGGRASKQASKQASKHCQACKQAKMALSTLHYCTLLCLYCASLSYTPFTCSCSQFTVVVVSISTLRWGFGRQDYDSTTVILCSLQANTLLHFTLQVLAYRIAQIFCK